MAIIFLGHTKCALCGEIISEGQHWRGLPPSGNKDHYLYDYFDCGFHEECFERWDKKDEIFKVIEDEKATFKNSEEYKEMVLKYGKPNK